MIRNFVYHRIITVIVTLLIGISLLCFTILQLRPEKPQPANTKLIKKRISFLITTPIQESYLAGAIGHEAILYVRSRETARITIKEFHQTGDRFEDYPTSGVLTSDADLFQQDDGLYLGLTPAKIGQDLILETSLITAKAIISSIED